MKTHHLISFVFAFLISMNLYSQGCGDSTTVELIENGDFELGNSVINFSSSYQFNTSVYSEGTYNIGSQASDFHPGFSGQGNGGTGNFLIVNGSSIPNQNVWCYTVNNIIPLTTYFFSVYVTTVAGGELAKLQFFGNGKPLSDPFFAPNEVGVWKQFYSLWTSDSSGTAEICLVNQNISPTGNDFGLDNFSFKASCASIKRSGPQPNLGQDTIVCGTKVDLKIKAGVPASSALGYKWNTGSVDSVLHITEPGDYVLCLDSAQLGCYKYDSIKVSLKQPLNPQTENTEICQYQDFGSFAVNYSQGNDLLWYNDTMSMGSQIVPWVNTAIPGNYTYFVSQSEKVNNYSCESYKSKIEVKINPAPISQLPEKIKICSGDSVIIGDPYNPSFTYNWSNAKQGIGDTSSMLHRTLFNKLAVPYDSLFVISIKERNTSCQTKDSTLVQVFPNPVLSLDSIAPVCVNAPAVPIIALPNGGVFNSPYVVNNYFQPTTIGKHRISYYYKDSNGCSDSIASSIIVKPYTDLGIDIGKDTSLCRGDSLQLQVNKGKNFQWSPVFSNSNNITISPLQSTMFKVKAVDSSACQSDEDSLFVQVDQPVGNLVQDHLEEHCFDDGPISITVSNAENFLWKHSKETSATVDINKPGIYFIRGRNGMCQKDDSIVVKEICITTLYVPDAFSPNQDNINDSFEIFGIHIYDYYLQVFNRWGKLIYETDDVKKFWDGTVNGIISPSGIYPYIITYSKKSENGEYEPLTKTGSITVVR